MNERLNYSIEMFEGSWKEFERYSGREFWKSRNGQPHMLYLVIFDGIFKPLKRLHKDFCTYCDTDAKNEFLGAKEEKYRRYIETLRDTIDQCVVKRENEPTLERMKDCIEIMNRIRMINPTKTQKCRTCGRELPMEAFGLNSSYKSGYTTECKECRNARVAARLGRSTGTSKVKTTERKPVSSAPTPTTTQAKPLQDYTPRELMAELARRGYTGKLEYVERHIIDITNF